MLKQKSNQTKDINVQLTSKPKKSFYWSPYASIIVPLVAYFVSQIVLIVPILIIYGTSNGNDDVLNDSAWAGLSLTGISAAALLAVLWVFIKSKKLNFSSLGFKKIKAKDIGYTLLAGFGYLILVGIVSAIATNIPGFNADQVQEVGYQNVAGWQLALAFIGLVVIPPIAEEMMFRGFMYRGLAYNHWNKKLIIIATVVLSIIVLSATKNLVAPIFILSIGLVSAFLGLKFVRFGAALFTSMLFGLVHMQWNVAVDVFILSLILIVLYEKTKNLWTCILLHALKNGVAFMFIFLFKI